ncbi:TonB-dependent receptor [Ravibacter arvi]|uniref:TonB-dependent receptor n=1 Tax=Ravibacter arvi TaxID=2051041 RepID=A0ABP8LW06_9BACT
MNRYFTLFLGVLSLLLFFSSGLMAQVRPIAGKVTLATDGSAVPGVTVVVKGSTAGTTTDANGNYTLNVPRGQQVIVYTFVGLEPQEITVGSGRSTVNVVMEESKTELSQVIVTGYSELQRRDVIGSIASVKNDRFKDLPITGFDQALQGQAAGVQVSQSSGTPGGGIAIRIRGNTSISASNRPLFIVDGTPVFDGSVTSRDFGGQNDNSLAVVNPNDIASIEVLKDASAKAIYGSRGANGVVIITTKRGRNNKTSVTADIQRGVVQLIGKPKLLNSTQLVELQRDAATAAGQNPDELGLIPGVTDLVNTDWVSEILRRGILQQYQLTASGGTEKTRFYFSGGVRDEEGVQLNNRFTRYTGALNLDHMVNHRLKFAANVNVSMTQNDRIKGDNFLDGVYSGAIKSLPYYSPYDEMGRLYVPNDPNYPDFPNFNPVGQALLPRFRTYGLKMIAGVSMDANLTKELVFRSKVSMDYNNGEEDQYEPSTTAIGGALPSAGGKGYGVYSTSTQYTLVNSNVFSYSKSIDDRHSLNALLGNEIIHTQARSSSVSGRMFPSNQFTYINSAGVVDQGGSFYAQSGLVSFFGEVKYDFKDKYLVGATLRTDGSSRFGQNRRFGYFPSVSAAWRLSEEAFLDKVKFLDDLKLRASYGFTGNERIGNFQYLGTWAAAVYNGNTGVGPNRLPNNNLQWERTNEINLGLDASMFENRLRLVAEVYRNLTDKLLYSEPIPLTTGYGSIQGNIGTVVNKGIEFSVSSDNLTGELKWSTDFNITRNLNNVKMLAKGDTLYRGYTASGVGATNAILAGQPLGTFWGLKFLGVDPATGNALYEDINGDGKISSEDGQVIGNAQPDFYGGLTNRISYKGFDLSILLHFMYGNKVLNLTKQSLLNAGEDIETNQEIAALRRWRKEGDVTDVPRYELGNTYNNYQSSRFVEDASFLRLKNVVVGYTLPARWVQRVWLQNARVFVTGTNLWTLKRYSGVDPEVSTLDGSTSAQGIDLYTLPQVKTIQGGITLSF